MEPLIDALVVAPHPDDAEIGVGGTLAMLAAAGKKTAIVDLTDGEPTPYGSPEIRARESAVASTILSLTERRNLGFKNRELFDTVECRKELASTIRELRPAILFIPYSEDAHPDHAEAASIGIAARFYSKFVKSDLRGTPWQPRQVFFYFGIHLRTKITPSFIIQIDNHLQTKMAAIRAYHSQFVVHPGNQPILESIEAEARYWGTRIQARYGEPFVSREHLGIRSPESLLSL